MKKRWARKGEFAGALGKRAEGGHFRDGCIFHLQTVRYLEEREMLNF